MSNSFAPPVDLPLTGERRRQANLLLLGCGLFMALLAGQYYLKIHHAPTRSAFLRWGNQIQDLLRGINIWEVHEYPNPPIMALVLVPYAQLPAVTGALAWFVCKAVLTLLAIHWVWRMLEHSHCLGSAADGSSVFPAWAKLAGLLLALGPVEGDLTHGNVNLFILFLLTAGLYAFVRGRDLEAGLLLGASIACKLTPLLFVPYFVWKRAWVTLAGCALSLVLCWGIIPGLAFGFQANADFFASWVEKMVVPYVLHGKVTTEHQNQSLPGLAHRLLTSSPSISERVGTEYFPREYHNVADLNPALVSRLLCLLMAAYVGLIVWTCRTPLAQRRDWRQCAEFSLVILGMLLFSERTWKHHCVLLLLPAAVLGFRLAAGSPRQTFVSWGALAGSGLLMLSAGSGFLPGQGRFGDLAQVYGSYTAALAVIVGALAWSLRPLATFGKKGSPSKKMEACPPEPSLCM